MLLHTALQSTHCSLLTALYSTLYSLRTALYSLLYSLHSTRYYLLNAIYSMLTALCSPDSAVCSWHWCVFTLHNSRPSRSSGQVPKSRLALLQSAFHEERCRANGQYKSCEYPSHHNTTAVLQHLSSQYHSSAAAYLITVITSLEDSSGQVPGVTGLL